MLVIAGRKSNPTGCINKWLFVLLIMRLNYFNKNFKIQ